MKAVVPREKLNANILDGLHVCRVTLKKNPAFERREQTFSK
jgi:hypothetical protein